MAHSQRQCQANAPISSLRNAHDSPLLRLPAEIRNRIYEYALYVRTLRTSRSGHIQGYHHLHALPHTCRQLKEETALLIFSLNSITFNKPVIDACALRLTAQQVGAVSRIRLKFIVRRFSACFVYWANSALIHEKEMQALDKFPNLRKLDITLVTGLRSDFSSRRRTRVRDLDMPGLKAEVRRRLDLDSRPDLRVRFRVVGVHSLLAVESG